MYGIIILILEKNMLIKKIILISLLLVFVFSCAKKEIIEEKHEKGPNRSEKPERKNP